MAAASTHSAVLRKALERGLVAPEASLSDAEIHRLILEPGFSTADQVTNLSGRGVGMDVVKSSIEALRGTLDIESTYGQGSTMRLCLPLTLASSTASRSGWAARPSSCRWTR